MALTTAVLFIVLGAVCAALARHRHLIMHLHWRTRLDYFPFRRRLRAVIAHSGFKVKISPEIPFDLEANIHGKLVLFICVPDNTSIDASKIVDWAEIISYRGKGRQLVCVTASPVHECLAREASSRSITLLHYKRLKEFLPLG